MTTRTFNTPEELMIALLQGEKWRLASYTAIFLYDKSHSTSPFRAMAPDGSSEAMNSAYSYCNGITVWHKVERKTELDLMKEKYKGGEYVLIVPEYRTNEWIVVNNPDWDCDNYRLIHKKHKDILDAYLANNNVEIEFNYGYDLWEKDLYFIEKYNETFEYRLKPKKKTVSIVKFYSSKGKILEMDKSKLTQIPKNIIDEYKIEVYDE